MSLQIAKIILYSRKGEVREVEFKPGKLNVLTGGSKTGKSAIIDILDYCTGRDECNVADGVIRRHVEWYAVLFQLNESQIFVARRNPALGEKKHADVYVERGTAVATPPASALFKNTTVDALEKSLGAAIGISENEHRPAQPTRDSLEANFRHALLFSFQDQNDIDSKQRLFHRQGEDFISQAIKDTLPYFLGAIDEDRLLKQAQLDQARRQLRQLERQLRDSEAVDNRSYPRAQALLDEAKHVGLVDERTIATTYEATTAILQRISRDSEIKGDAVMGDGEDMLASLRAERQGLRSELERVNLEVRSTRNFSLETNGYEREAKEQRARLSAVGLIRQSDHDASICPVCESHLEAPAPTVTQIARSLQDLSEQLETVEAENPRLQVRLASLLAEESALQDRLRDNQIRINARTRENEILQVQQENFIVQARAIGKISQYLETATTGDVSSNLPKQIETAKSRVALLEAELDADTIRENLNTFMNIIGRYMDDYSDKLELEHRGSLLRLDIRNLTVVADTVDGPVSLFRMGSAENWVGYHVLAHLALHKWFRKKRRPVPGFVLFDQPSQAHYPADRDVDGSLDGLGDEDQKAVHLLFKLISDVAVELAPDLQIIVMDHADLKHDWFQSAVVERWRKGRKLVPESWQG